MPEVRHGARADRGDRDDENPELADMSRRFWWSAALTAPILALMAADVVMETPPAMSFPAVTWIELALATPVVVWGGLPFFQRGWASIVSLFFAFVYNALGVPVAAGALYPYLGCLLSPMFASAAMTFSSVSVIANALRLRRTEL